MTRGDVAHAGRRRTDKLKDVLAWLGVLSLVATAIVGYVAISTVGDVRDNDDAQIALVRRAAWRLCERDMRDRALAHAFVQQSDALKLVQQQNPIVDCDPNLVGEPAKPLPPHAQEAFVRRWQRGELEPLPEPPTPPAGLKKPHQ